MEYRIKEHWKRDDMTGAPKKCYYIQQEIEEGLIFKKKRWVAYGTYYPLFGHQPDIIFYTKKAAEKYLKNLYKPIPN